jgi:hypothetical protein
MVDALDALGLRGRDPRRIHARWTIGWNRSSIARSSITGSDRWHEVLYGVEQKREDLLDRGLRGVRERLP